jgi:hypothetical protein
VRKRVGGVGVREEGDRGEGKMRAGGGERRWKALGKDVLFVFSLGKAGYSASNL